MLHLGVKRPSIVTVGEGRTILSVFLLHKMDYISFRSFFYLIGKGKTGNPDSDKAQVIENVTLKY